MTYVSKNTFLGKYRYHIIINKDLICSFFISMVQKARNRIRNHFVSGFSHCLPSRCASKSQWLWKNKIEPIQDFYDHRTRHKASASRLGAFFLKCNLFPVLFLKCGLLRCFGVSWQHTLTLGVNIC